jgi:TRAP-type uncharacterized transport system substrate-binding protein
MAAWMRALFGAIAAGIADRFSMTGFFQGRKAAEFLNATEELSGVSLNEPESGFFRSLSNRKQVILFVVATLVLTAVTIWAARVWFRNTSTLTFAVAADNGVEARFANKLANVLAANNSSLRLKIDKNTDSDKALSVFDRKQADLAILRTDQKVPGRARAVAVLDKDLVLLLSPKGKKITNLEALKGKKIAILGNDDRNESFFRRAVSAYDIANPRTSLQTVPTTSAIDKLLAPNAFAAVIMIENAARLGKDRSFERLAKSQTGFVLNPIPEAKAIERKVPGIFAETIEEGLLSASPQIPDDDLQSIGLQWMLIVQSSLSDSKGSELARILFENKSQLALDDGFAAHIEPADTDKDSYISAHRGAAQYFNDDTKSFLERYSELIYVGLAALSIIGSIFVGLYTAFTRVAPEKAGALAASLLEIGEKVEDTKTIEALDQLQEQFEAILKQVVAGLRDGSVSADGLDTFRLGYEFVRDTLQLRRETLARRAGREENMVVVAKAVS